MDLNANLNEENEVVQHRELNIAFIVDEANFGKGTLYVAESKLYWKNDDSNQVVSVDYKSMCVFGTCNHPTVHEKPCMQVIVDFTYKPSDSILCENGNHHTEQLNNGEDIDSEENYGVTEDEGEMKSKIKLVPDNPECLTAMYEAFTRVQPLHNTGDVDSDEEDGEFYYNEEDEFEDYDEDSNEQMLMN